MIGNTYRALRTSSLSPAAMFSRVASFSVVIINLGEGNAAKVLLINSTSLAVKL